MDLRPEQSTVRHPWPHTLVLAALLRLALLAFAWGALTEGAGWRWGLGAAALLAGFSLIFIPPAPGRLRLAAALIALLPVLARDSLLGGWDVARRALLPGRRLNPGLEEVPLQRPSEPVAFALAYAATVMPGSLAVEVAPDRLRLHVIDRDLDTRGAVRELERRLAGRPR